MIDPNPDDNVKPRKHKAMPAEATTGTEFDTQIAPDPDSPHGPGSAAGDIDAAGTAGGGTEVGGLGGTNTGDGAPENADIDEAMGDAIPTNERENTARGPYGGPTGGAVGGAIANRRATGGKTRGGMRPGGVHRGDSTIGTNPDSGAD